MAGESLVTPIIALMALVIVSSLFVAARRPSEMVPRVAACLTGGGGLSGILVGVGGVPVYTYFCDGLCAHGWMIDFVFYFIAICIASGAAIVTRPGRVQALIAAPAAFVCCFLVLQAGTLQWFS
jgi:hypothetical protein